MKLKFINVLTRLWDSNQNTEKSLSNWIHVSFNWFHRISADCALFNLLTTNWMNICSCLFDSTVMQKLNDIICAPVNLITIILTVSLYLSLLFKFNSILNECAEFFCLFILYFRSIDVKIRFASHKFNVCSRISSTCFFFICYQLSVPEQCPPTICMGTNRLFDAWMKSRMKEIERDSHWTRTRCDNCIDHKLLCHSHAFPLTTSFYQLKKIIWWNNQIPFSFTILPVYCGRK